jgi:SAM-dependent methyltransferase
VCGSPRTAERGTVEYLSGFPRQVFDCEACGCRFTSLGVDIHERLHAAPAISYYVTYRELAQKSRWFFDGGDVAGLKGALSALPKYAFVIAAIEKQPMSAVLMELGCSRGYLTSCFILEGRNIIGVDVSPEAVKAAKEAFGDHFAVAGSAAAESAGPFDVIYHVGTIGCVADPIGVTRRLLARLRPGGRLLFNAPNRNALHDPTQLWFDSAPPPEVVTLFPEGFFARHFSDAADVQETAQVVSDQESFSIALRLRRGRRWVPPEPKSLSGPEGQAWSQPHEGGLVERVITKFAALTGLQRLAARRSSEYGLFVEMVAR